MLRNLLPKSSLLVWSAFFVLSACRFEGNMLQSYRHLPDEGWCVDSLVYIPVPVADTTEAYDMTLRLRHTDDYPYSNLWLFVTAVAPDGTQTVDTVNIPLSDEYGRWLGSGIGATMQREHLWRPSFRFGKSGLWHIVVQQGMRDSLLPGVTDIGLKVAR